jgi:uncharacterized protein (TIGR00296 family)
MGDSPPFSIFECFSWEKESINAQSRFLLPGLFLARNDQPSILAQPPSTYFKAFKDKSHNSLIVSKTTMMLMLTLEEGKMAVRLARDALTNYIEQKKIIVPKGLPSVFDELRGVFVTLHLEGDLRGCIGYPQPVMPLGRAIVDSAINACSRDPRFPCVRASELKRIELEVTILTKPEVYTEPKKKLPELVTIGRDGLIVTKGPFSGLLLPQVAPEWGFDSLEFLSQTCVKAGLPPDAWMDEDTQVQHFKAQIYAEVAPEREVIEKSYTENSCGT